MNETLLSRIENEMKKIIGEYNLKRDKEPMYIGSGFWADENGKLYHKIEHRYYPVVELR